MTLEASATPKLNRLALFALIAALLSLPRVLLAVLMAFGIIYRWIPEGHPDIQRLFAATNLVFFFVSFAIDMLTFLALILGAAAYVQIGCRPGTTRGKGVALAAVILTIGGSLLAYLIWFLSAIRQFV
jgi:hypothetical protein